MDRTLPDKVIATDERLRTRISKDSDALRAMRYEWCVTRGWGYTEYARSVGLVGESIRQSVLTHAHRNGLPTVNEAVRAKEAQRVGKGRAASAMRRANTKPPVKPKLQTIALPQAVYDEIRAAACSEGISVVRWVTEVLTAFLAEEVAA